MLPAAVSGRPDQRTAADNQTVRNVFIIGPDKKIKLEPGLSDDGRPHFDEVLRVIDLAAAWRQAQGGDAGELEAGRRRDHCSSVTTTTPRSCSRRAGSRPKPYIRVVPQPK